MPSFLVRDLDNQVLEALKSSAKRKGRSLQAEVHEILQQAGTRSLAETRRLSARWLKRLRGSVLSDSTELIREDRDSR